MSKSFVRAGAFALVLQLAGCMTSPTEFEDDVSEVENALTSNGLSATLSLSSQWNSGYCADVSLVNTGATAISSWEVQIDLTQSTFASGWSANITSSGGRLVAKPLDWNRNLDVGATTSFGFCGNTSAAVRPVVVSVVANGSAGGSGGSTGTGGSTSTGGTSPTGGGTSTGGSISTSSSTGTCTLPSSFKWTSSGSLADPKSPSGANWASLKDFTVTKKNSEYLVYASVFDVASNAYQGAFLKFGDFSQMRNATQVSKPGMVAPHLFYFSPKNIWVLSYQWGFKYATSATPENPASWSATRSLLSNNPTTSDPAGTGPIDQSLICDGANCYIFFAGDNGVIYRGSMPIGNFPGTFGNAAAILRDSPTALFEGVEVYKIKGQNKYLMIVEAAGNAAQPWGSRFFRAFTADSLGGSWTAMPSASSRATPFAGSANVTFPGGKWTDDISHGDLVREDPSERKEVDLCSLRFLYQGKGSSNAAYNSLPYRPGLLTLVR
ncbi:MAG TPA: non-reducing end alpha-L-arabinofuranosidase family hydrolase [Polyangiaceae bacterium]|nr:non-reducing end alpha-L-arabinofuranosidase family hydrolase [Polyangiaceae bacterium]